MGLDLGGGGCGYDWQPYDCSSASDKIQKDVENGPLPNPNKTHKSQLCS